MKDLTRDQKAKLLKLARETIRTRLSGKNAASPDMKGEFSEEIFSEKCGAFVTIHISGRLRGCIGYIVGQKNIPETVLDMSQASAFRDPRFSPLSSGEFKNIDIEISVLSPIEKVVDISEIKIGRDGLIITHGHRSGLLLPQVATEQGWNLDQFLENTCYKAGLPGDAWKWKDIQIEKFSAQVFGEKEPGLTEEKNS
jgi:AmmeMemoRadiSam system protein A